MIKYFPLFYVTAKGYVNVTANSAHSILLSHNLTESGVYYKCDVTEVKGGEKKRQANNNVTTQPTTVTELLPGTTYRVDCVAYRSDGVEACLEVNTTVTTRELHYKGHSKLAVLTIQNADFCQLKGSLHILQFQTECRMSQSEVAEYNKLIVAR